jgi:hypothetical protein
MQDDGNITLMPIKDLEVTQVILEPSKSWQQSEKSRRTVKKKNTVSLEQLGQLDLIREQGGYSVKEIEAFKKRI